MTVLVVGKLPGINQYDEASLERLEALGSRRRMALEKAKHRHETALAAVESALADIDHRTVTIADLASTDITPELVITVGGDGTVLATQAVIRSAPVLAVNSDPERSIGHFTRCHAGNFAQLLAEWQSGDAAQEQLHRLRLWVGDREAAWFLNDCLVTNANPAKMSRYELTVGHVTETQDSSGIWISTCSGATGGIASAGMIAQVGQHPTLLFKVREPFQQRGPYRLLDGIQQPPQEMTLLPTAPGLCAFIDGGHSQQIDVPTGIPLVIDAAPDPLRLVVPRSPESAN